MGNELVVGEAEIVLELDSNRHQLVDARHLTKMGYYLNKRISHSARRG